MLNVIMCFNLWEYHLPSRSRSSVKEERQLPLHRDDSSSLSCTSPKSTKVGRKPSCPPFVLTRSR